MTKNQHPTCLQYRPRYRPDVEGLRAVAVLIVVFFHAQVPGFEGGFVGVDVFFVLSGFLITWLLVNEAEQTGGVDLRRFYARRARRLLPAMALVLVVTLAVTALLYAPSEQRTLAQSWAATSLYISNVYFAWMSLSYHGVGASVNPLLHTWSLSVEEQFYLVWPWLVILGLGSARWQRQRFALSPKRLMVVLGLATAASFALSVYLTPREGSWAFYLSPMRAWEFGVGGLAVLIPIGSWPRRTPGPVSAAMPARALSALGLLGLVASTVLFDSRTPFPGVAALLPVLSTAVLLRAGTPEESDGITTQILSLPILQGIGKRSYSWYLWHWPALVFAAELVKQPTAGVRLVAVLTSLLIAVLSYRFVETPLRHHRALARPARSLALVFVFSAAGFAAAVLWWSASSAWSASEVQSGLARVREELPQIYADDCDHFGSGEFAECVYGDTLSGRTAVLLGDSHAGQWFPAVHEAARERGWRLVVLTLSACPMTDTPALYNDVLGRVYPECPAWRRRALDAIGRLKPDVTFVASSNGYDVPERDWQSGTRTFMASVSKYSTRTVLVAGIPVAGVDVPSCLARADWRMGSWLDPDCTPHDDLDARRRALAQIRALSDLPRVEVLNLRDAVCPDQGCRPTVNGLVRYRDNGHLSHEFALTFRQSFGNYLPATGA